MRFGPGILPSLTIMSNNEGEIPTYAAASARDKPRGGRECGSTFLDFPVFSGVKLAVRLEGTANYVSLHFLPVIETASCFPKIGCALRTSISPEILEPGRRQLGIAHRMLDVLVAKVSLKGSGVVPLGGQRKAAGMP